MTTRPLWKKPAYGLIRSMPKTIEAQLSRANCMHSDAASQGGGWWQGCGAAYSGVSAPNEMLGTDRCTQKETVPPSSVTPPATG